MAERRMFSKSIIDSDAFLDMPLSTQALYFHLCMRADDDGFVNNAKKIQRVIGGSEDDFKLLVAKSFIIPFDSGVIVIKHWRIHNYIRSDRYKETVYTEEKAVLTLKDNQSYTIGIPTDHQIGDNLDTQVSLKEVSTDKRSIYIEFADGDEDLLKALKDFEEMRKKKKKPLTDRAKKMLCNRLKEFPRSEWVELLEQSITHCWDTVYPLKKEGNVTPSSSAMDDLRELHDLFSEEDG